MHPPRLGESYVTCDKGRPHALAMNVSENLAAANILNSKRPRLRRSVRIALLVGREQC